MKADKTAKSFQPIEFSLSKFDNLDPTYQTSKKRELDRLETIWQFYQPSSCLSKKKRLFYPILRDKTLFFFKTKKDAQNQRANLIF